MTEQQEIEMLTRHLRAEQRALDNAEYVAVKESNLADKLGTILQVLVDEYSWHFSTKALESAENAVAEWKQERYWRY